MADKSRAENLRKLAQELRDQEAREAAALEKRAELALIALKGLNTLRNKVSPR